MKMMNKTMKKKENIVRGRIIVAFATLVSLFLLAMPGVSAQTCAQPTTPLLTWYQAEGNALDAVSSNDGVLTGTVTFGPGEVNQGFQFDGATGYIDSGDALDPTFGDFSIDFWYSATPSTQSRTIIGKGITSTEGLTRPGYYVDLPSSGGIRCIFSGDDSSTIYGVTAPAATLDGQSHNIACVLDRFANQIALYEDNAVIGTASAVGLGNIDSALPLGIGALPGPSSVGTRFYYDGMLDEIMFFDGALDNNQVADIYNAGPLGVCQQPAPACGDGTIDPGEDCDGTNLGVADCTTIPGGYTGGTLACNPDCTFDTTGCTTPTAVCGDAVCDFALGESDATCSQDCQTCPANMELWYKADGDATDAVGNHPGTATGVTYVPGEVGQAFNFDGSSYVTTPPTASLNLPSFTIDAWAKGLDSTNQGSKLAVIMAKNVGGSSANGGFMLAYDNRQVGSALPQTTDSLRFLVFQGSGVTSEAFVTSVNSAYPLSDGNYHHIAGTFDGSVAKLYIDGALAATGSAISSVLFNTKSFAVGAFSDGNFGFNGQADEVEYISGALSQTDIQNIVNAGSAGKCTSQAPSLCGNGVLDAGEECDNGALNTNTCAPPYGGSCSYCSDGTDLNSACTLQTIQGAYCGDGVTNSPDEECDDANTNNNDACLNSCTFATCGDGVLCVDPSCTSGPTGSVEECDAGALGSATCDSNCALAVAGSAVVNMPLEVNPAPGEIGTVSGTISLTNVLGTGGGGGGGTGAAIGVPKSSSSGSLISRILSWFANSLTGAAASNVAPSEIQAWTISAEVLGDCRFASATVSTFGTDNAAVVNGQPLHDVQIVGDSAEMPEKGLVTAVLLQTEPTLVTIPPGATEAVLDYTLETLTPVTSPVSCTVQFVDGLQGTGQPIHNLAVVDGEDAKIIGEPATVVFNALVPCASVCGDTDGNGVIEEADKQLVLEALANSPADPVTYLDDNNVAGPGASARSDCSTNALSAVNDPLNVGDKDLYTGAPVILTEDDAHFQSLAIFGTQPVYYNGVLYGVDCSGAGITPPVCGDGVCDTAGGENSINCAVDCGVVGN